MKKLLITLSIFILFSCKKEMAPTYWEDPKTKSVNLHKPTSTSELYSSSLFDNCTGQNIQLTGVVNYRITEVFDNGYYIDYRIDTDNLTGISEAGVVYKGSIKFEGRTKASPEGDVIGKVSYKLKLTCPTGQIIFTQQAKFILINGVTKIDFNNISEDCK